MGKMYQFTIFQESYCFVQQRCYGNFANEVIFSKMYIQLLLTTFNCMLIKTNYVQLHERILTKNLTSTTFKYMNVYQFNYFFKPTHIKIFSVVSHFAWKNGVKV